VDFPPSVRFLTEKRRPVTAEIQIPPPLSSTIERGSSVMRADAINDHRKIVGESGGLDLILRDSDFRVIRYAFLFERRAALDRFAGRRSWSGLNRSE
jgi:hypothetical protein